MRDARVEFITNAPGGATTADGPARLMRQADVTPLDTDDYPLVSGAVAVESDGKPVTGVDEETLSVVEGDTSRDMHSVEPVAEALDIAFVFDDTGSMTDEIDGAKQGVTELTEAIEQRGLDTRYALVTFKDQVDLDQRFTPHANQLIDAVEQLTARAGGDTPEVNFDAIERALGLDWRTDAEQVVVDITDAPSHYEGDGSGFAEYTFGDVVRDVRASDVTFISISPDEDNETDSAKSVAEAVDGLWTDIDDLRSGAFDGEGSEGGFQAVLHRITSLVTSAYSFTYRSGVPPGKRQSVTVTLEHPEYETASDSAIVSVPDSHSRRLERHDTAPTPAAHSGDDSETVTRGDARSVADRSSEPIPLAVVLDRDGLTRGESVTVTVRDNAGNRVENAVVETAEVTEHTDHRGTCRLTPTTTGELRVSARVPDAETDETYESDSTTVTVRPD